MKNISISVIIPNFNGQRLLAESIPPLISNLEKYEHEIIIADDASTDNSVQYIKENYPSINIVTGKNNAGFSININRGIAQATKKLCFLMNSDIILGKNYFDKQLSYFEDRQTFGVMGQIIGFYDNKTQDTAKYPARCGVLIDGSKNYIKNEQKFPSMLPSLFLSGANALVDTAKLKELNGFDEIFSPFYGEDLDLGLRAWRMGWKCWYEHSAVCKHKTSSTIKATNSQRKVQMIATRNKFFLHFIHLDGIERIFWFFVVILSLILKFFSMKFSYYRGFFMFLKKIGVAAGSRKRLLEKQKYSLRGIYSLCYRLIGVA